MEAIKPIIVILLWAALGGVAYFYIHKRKKKSVIHLKEAQITANEFVNIRDIQDKFLYTRDGQAIAYIKIHPISIDLFSDSEKETMCRTLTAELSSLQKPFKFLAVSRPVDITPLVNEYSKLLAESTDPMQKELLRHELMVVGNYAISGEVIERQFYLMLWCAEGEGCERELMKECRELLHKLESAGIQGDMIHEQEIMRLCNLINNPADINYDEAAQSTI